MWNVKATAAGMNCRCDDFSAEYPTTGAERLPTMKGVRMATWHFMLQRPGETTREPIQGEFFATEAISNTAAALVREGNQTRK